MTGFTASEAQNFFDLKQKMKLLILTQKVDKNDDILGFFYGWLEEFSKHFESIIVICLYEGKHTLPKNVRVFSLGKEVGVSRLRYTINFFRYIRKFRKEYDAVFVHMNPEYVTLGGLLWRAWGKKIGLWYTHRQVNLKLLVAEKLAHSIFTASGVSFGISSKKVHVLGHGIDVKKFESIRQNAENNGTIKILSAGRITPIKNLDIIIEAVDILRTQVDIPVSLHLVGMPVSEMDTEYKKKLEKLVQDKGLADIVFFDGSVPFLEMPQKLASADIAVNVCPTGGVDKAVVEAWASGVPTIVSNEAFSEYLGEYANILMFKERDAKDLAEKLGSVISDAVRYKIGLFLREKAKSAFSQSVLIERISENLKQI
jgi:glycosyltransferase involved in cell wall biosynthesis